MTATKPVTARTAAVALAITLVIQVFTALAVAATAVLAPAIARDLAVSPKLIGVFVGLVYVGSATASLASGGFIARHGPIRVSQVCVLLSAAGLAALPLATAGAGAGFVLIALAPIVIGLGYGPITPASSHLLVRTAPPARVARTFSLKQTGVPAGVALAGAGLPGLALAFGWRPTFIAVAAVGIVIAAVAQPTRSRLDADRSPEVRVSLAGVLAPLRLVLRKRELAELALTGFTYAASQMCVLSFLVVYLTEEMGLALVAAGFALTVANVGGIAGRIAWGAVADRFIRPRTLLGLIGMASGGCGYVIAGSAAAWPTAALLAVCALYGATAIGWNGVQLAQVARLAPVGHAGAVTGAIGFVTFAGVVIGPPAFALLATVTGSYRAGFVAFGSLSLLCGLWLLRTRRK
jgi:MFS family permease